MKRHLIASLISIPLLVSGCATTPPGGGAPNYDAIIAQVVQITTAVCSFVPTANTVLEILNVGGLSTASAIASAICAAVVPPRASPSGQVIAPRLGTVRGVPVRGRFVR